MSSQPVIGYSARWKSTTNPPSLVPSSANRPKPRADFADRIADRSGWPIARNPSVPSPLRIVSRRRRAPGVEDMILQSRRWKLRLRAEFLALCSRCTPGGASRVWFPPAFPKPPRALHMLANTPPLGRMVDDGKKSVSGDDARVPQQASRSCIGTTV
jgi:hypothetical protein